MRRKCEEVLSTQTAGSLRRYVTLPRLFFPVSRLSPRPRCSRRTLNPRQELSGDAVAANGGRISGGAEASDQSVKPPGAQKRFPSWQQRYLLSRSNQQEDVTSESGSHSSAQTCRCYVTASGSDVSAAVGERRKVSLTEVKLSLTKDDLLSSKYAENKLGAESNSQPSNHSAPLNNCTQLIK